MTNDRLVLSGEVILTKITVAQRQLDAAIRLFFREEEKEAITTLGAAAFRLLRDLVTSRGVDFIRENLKYGLVSWALALAKGDLSSEQKSDIPKESLALLQDMAEWIRTLGLDVTKEEIVRRVNLQGDIGEREIWNAWNRAPNFLKHADKDAGNLLPESELRYLEQIQGALAAYIKLNCPVTPEMRTWWAFWSAEEELAAVIHDPLNKAIFEAISGSRPDQRRAKCLKVIADLKNAGDKKFL